MPIRHLLIAFLCLAQAYAQDETTRSITLDARLLNLPVCNGAPKQLVKLEVGGKKVREFEIEFTSEKKPDFYVFLDVTAWKGQSAILRGPSSVIAAIENGDEIKTSVPVYAETWRPQFHFTARRGRLNDPNGLLHYDGEHHLFYQLHPYGVKSGSKSWGHAVSRDFLHWEELPIAIHAEEEGMMFSGSGVVDWKNTTGFQSGKEPPLVLIYTATGPPRDQRLAFSNNRGRTWTKYAGNPVLPEVAHNNRDPKVFWHEPTQRWVMILHCTEKGKKLPPIDPKDPKRKTGEFVFFTSPDLKQWKREGSVIGFAECPDLFPMKIEGTEKTKWIVHGGLGEYFVGDFDGRNFMRTSDLLHGPYGSAYYAGQNYSDMRDGRVVQQGWAKMGDNFFPGMPFAQMMNIPCEITLRNTGRGPRLVWQPVREIETLRTKHHAIAASVLNAQSDPLRDMQTPFFDLHAAIEVGTATEITLDLRGTPFVIDVKKQKLTSGKVSMPMPIREGRIDLRLLSDHSLIEIFTDHGFKFGAFQHMPKPDARIAPKLTASGGEAKIVSLDVRELKSVWPISKKN
jgi:fructan beta-fructosidase